VRQEVWEYFFNLKCVRNIGNSCARGGVVEEGEQWRLGERKNDLKESKDSMTVTPIEIGQDIW
jgi:hypothetical protein